MKRKLLILTIFCSILIFSSIAYGQSNIQVYLNNNKVDFPDAAPFISANRTLVPVRFIAESLGAEVKWSDATKEVTILKDYDEIVLKIGEKKARLGSKIIELDTNAIIKDTRTFVPLRFISETLNANVEWEASTSSVFITTAENKDIVIKPVGEVIKPSADDPLGYAGLWKNTKDIENYDYFTLIIEASEKHKDKYFVAVNSQGGTGVGIITMGYIDMKEGQKQYLSRDREWMYYEDDPYPSYYVELKDGEVHLTTDILFSTMFGSQVIFDIFNENPGNWTNLEESEEEFMKDHK